MPVILLTGVLDDGTETSRDVPEQPRVQLRLIQGASTTVRMQVLNPSGVLVDLNSPAATLTLTAKKKTSVALAALSVAGAIQTVDGKGRVDFTIAPAATKNVTPGRYFYDVWYVAGSTREPLVPTSPLTLEPAVLLP